MSSASGDDRRKKLEDFRQKDVSLLKNNKFQCFETSVLFSLLQNQEFRDAIVLKLEMDMPLPQHVVNAHLSDNQDEDWLHKMACEVGALFGDNKRQHDAYEFLEGLLEKLDLPPHLFTLETYVEIKCQGEECRKLDIPTYTETAELQGIYSDL